MAEDGEVVVDGLQLLLSQGGARYVFEISFDGSFAFILHEENPAEDPQGVIDAAPHGNIEMTEDGFVAVYPEGWEPPRRLLLVVESTLREMYILSRKGVVVGPDGKSN